MDDPDDRAYARAPQLEDVIGLCRALNAERARYALIGGFAVVLHGFVRATKDIDLLVDASEDNIRAVKRALATLPDNAAAELLDGEVAQYGVVRVADEIIVDLMARACGLDYAAAEAAGLDRFELEGVEIPTANKEFLIRTKQTYRDHDRVDVRYLIARIEEENRRDL